MRQFGTHKSLKVCSDGLREIILNKKIDYIIFIKLFISCKFLFNKETKIHRDQGNKELEYDKIKYLAAIFKTIYLQLFCLFFSKIRLII